MASMHSHFLRAQASTTKETCSKNTRLFSEEQITENRCVSAGKSEPRGIPLTSRSDHSYTYSDLTAKPQSAAIPQTTNFITYNKVDFHGELQK